MNKVNTMTNNIFLFLIVANNTQIISCSSVIIINTIHININTIINTSKYTSIIISNSNAINVYIKTITSIATNVRTFIYAGITNTSYTSNKYITIVPTYAYNNN